MTQRLKPFLAIAGFVAVIWVVLLLDQSMSGTLTRSFGLIPRHLGGLDGIVASPLLHLNAHHAAANSIPLLVFGLLMTLSAPHRLVPATIFIILAGGLATWALGREAVHVGASGLIFGWFGFLLARGLVDRTAKTAAVALLVAMIYGTMIWGILPSNGQTSWEGHLFGALAGAGAAWLLREKQGALV